MKNDDLHKVKLAPINFIKSICAIGIIIFHVSCYTDADSYKFFLYFANGEIGPIIVNLFLITSGFLLYYNNGVIKSKSVFYYKRWKSIFPMFYMVYIIFFTNNVFLYKSFFYKGNPVKLLFTVLGIDGYILYKYPNYYIVGEWFLGAIIILYVLYPVLVKLISKYNYYLLFIIVPLLICQLESNIFLIPERRNIIYISFVFIVGILINKNNIYKNYI